MLFLSFQIAAVANSTEYRLGLNKNAHMKGLCRHRKLKEQKVKIVLGEPSSETVGIISLRFVNRGQGFWSSFRVFKIKPNLFCPFKILLGCTRRNREQSCYFGLIAILFGSTELSP